MSKGDDHFDDDVAGTLSLGTLLARYLRLKLAIRDRKLDRADLEVLVDYYDHIGHETGFGYPSRRLVAEHTGLAEKTVHNSAFKLRARGYLNWMSGRVPNVRRPLLRYTVPVASHPQDEIERAIAEIRAAAPKFGRRTARSSGHTRSSRHAHSGGHDNARSSRQSDCPLDQGTGTYPTEPMGKEPKGERGAQPRAKARTPRGPSNGSASRTSPFPQGDEAKALYVDCRRVAIFEFRRVNGKNEWAAFRSYYLGTGEQRANWLEVFRGWLRKPFSNASHTDEPNEFDDVDIGQEAEDRENELVDILFEEAKKEQRV